MLYAFFWVIQMPGNYPEESIQCNTSTSCHFLSKSLLTVLHLSFDTECISRLHSIVTSSKEETPLCKRLCVKEFTLCKFCYKFSPSTCSQISSITKYVVLICSCSSCALQGNVCILYLVSLS